MTTTHHGNAHLTNDWGSDLASVTLRHRRSNDPEKQEEQTWNNVAAGAVLSPLQFTYETGMASPFDYWWVKLVTTGGHTYQCKDNFYCSVSSSDDGEVQLTLDGAPEELRVSFSESSGCTVSVWRSDK
jgi:hypothetical protein